VQQLIDCSPYDSGCNGGMPHTAYNYIQQSGGIQSWSSYPFFGYQGYCRYNPNAVIARVAGYTSAGSTNEDVIAAYLYKTGPLAITINASSLQYYQGGIYNVPYNYCPYAPDHGVVLVGYGVTNSGQKYWIVKNSWGSSWGEAGYFRIARGVGLCGVNQYVISAILA
jgi:cathepsin F